MKNFKRIASLVLALTMILCMGITAFAANITINDGDVTGASYEAYRILIATNAIDESGNATTKFSYTINEKYRDVLETVTGKTDDADIIAYIDDLKNPLTTGEGENVTVTKTSDERVREFADAIYAAIDKANIENDYTANNNVFANVEQGYYLIVETVTGTIDNVANDTKSLVMLDTAGANDLTVTTKEDAPSVDKKVEEKNDSTGATDWVKVADYDIGDDVPYEIIGELSSKYANYKTYYYSFEDTFSEGLTYNNDAKVYVRNFDENGNAVDTEITAGFTSTYDSENRKLTVTTDDLKNVTTAATISENSRIVVKYTAELNDSATVGGGGNENTVVVKYNNDPYYEGEGEQPTGVTPPSIAVVFTFKSIVNKVDSNNTALEGAGFTLYKWVVNGVVKVNEAGKPVDENGEELADSADPVMVNGWVQVGTEVTDVTTFTFSGLDAGKYKLVESTVPAGYNKAEDVEFEIVATYKLDSTTNKQVVDKLTVNDKDGNNISSTDTNNTTATFAVVIDDGSVETDVINNSGTELPSTGGIGTTIFYICGGVLLVGAAVLLITKRRMNVGE